MPAPSDLPPPEVSAEDARRSAEEILARPEFDEPPRSLLEIVADWVAERLADLLGRVFGSGGSSPVSWFVGALMLAAVAFLVWRLIRNRQRRQPRTAEPFDVETKAGRPPTDWDAEAVEHERADRWRDALRCRHRALIARLARRGVIDEIPGRTAGEYRRALQAAVPSVDAEFGEVTKLFEGVWYGGRDAGPSDGERFRALSDRVLEEAAR